MASAEQTYGPWLRQRVVAKIFDVGYETIERWRHNGDIAFTKVGRSVRIPRSEVDRLLREKFVERTAHEAIQKEEERKQDEARQFRSHDHHVVHPHLRDRVRAVDAGKGKAARRAEGRDRRLDQLFGGG